MNPDEFRKIMALRREQIRRSQSGGLEGYAQSIMSCNLSNVQEMETLAAIDSKPFKTVEGVKYFSAMSLESVVKNITIFELIDKLNQHDTGWHK